MIPRAHPFARRRVACGFLTTGALVVLWNATIPRASAMGSDEEWSQPVAARDEPVPVETGAPPVDKGYTFELGARSGYASAPIHGGTNPFGVGLGGRAGFAFSNLYLGASVVYDFGGRDVDVTDHAVLFGVEGGRDFVLMRSNAYALTLRALFGLGEASISHTDPSLATVDVVSSASGSSSSLSSDTVTVHALYVEPQLATMIASGSHYLALNANALILPSIRYGASEQSATWLSYGLRGELGFRF